MATGSRLTRAGTRGRDHSYNLGSVTESARPSCLSKGDKNEPVLLKSAEVLYSAQLHVHVHYLFTVHGVSGYDPVQS